MGQRLVRVNELVKREISDVLHTRFQTEAAMRCPETLMTSSTRPVIQ